MEPAPERSDFDSSLARHGLKALKRGAVTTLQVNLGMRCDLACHHCHVEAGPARTETMDARTAARVLDVDANEIDHFHFYDASDALISSILIPDQPDGSVQLVPANVSGVRRAVLDLGGSGAVTRILFCPDPPEERTCLRYPMSSCIVRIRTFVSGSSRRMLPRASRPPQFGMLMSIRMMSGLSANAFS